MAWDLTNDLDTGNNRKIDLLKSSLIATFGNGPPNHVGQLRHRQHRDAGAIAGLPVRHPRQLRGERVG